MAKALPLMFLWSLFMFMPLVHLGEAARMSEATTVVAATSRAPKAVSTSLGNIQGRSCLLVDGVTEYLGIPYAQPPVGDLRFRPPVKYGTQYPSPSLPALANPPACGTYSGAIGSLQFQSVNSSEDCLYLNMWAPENAAKSHAKLPVRVFIHGGHDLECSASDPYLNGCNYAFKTNSIVVNIQFRKGPFGWLAHPATLAESNTTGNWAALDQQLALRWVQENIAFFGGDPSKVLLNGNSAGAQYVDFQMVSPLSKGLFSAAISQSPPCVRLLSLEQAYTVAASFMEKVGCSPSAAPASELACIRSKPWATLFDTASEINLSASLQYAECESLTWSLGFQAVVDGMVFPHAWEEAIDKGAFHAVPYMVGFTAQEGTHFVDPETVTNTTIVEMLESNFPSADIQQLLALYPIDRYQAAGFSDAEKARMASIWTDLYFKCPIHKRISKLVQSGATDTYLYRWEVTPTCPPEYAYLGASHASELLFSYGTVKQIYPPWGDCDFNLGEVAVSDILLTAWSSMNDGGVPRWADGEAWAKWTPEGQQGTVLQTWATKTDVVQLADLCSVVEATREEALVKLALQVVA